MALTIDPKTGHLEMGEPMNYIKVEINGDLFYLPFTDEQINQIKSSKAKTVSLQIKVDVDDKTGQLEKTKVWL